MGAGHRNEIFQRVEFSCAFQTDRLPPPRPGPPHSAIETHLYFYHHSAAPLPIVGLFMTRFV